MTMKDDNTYTPLTAEDLAPSDEYLQPYRDAEPMVERIAARLRPQQSAYPQKPDGFATQVMRTTTATFYGGTQRTHGDK
jgi:hypothetical protein